MKCEQDEVYQEESICVSEFNPLRWNGNIQEDEVIETRERTVAISRLLSDHPSISPKTQKIYGRNADLVVMNFRCTISCCKLTVCCVDDSGCTWMSRGITEGEVESHWDLRRTGRVLEWHGWDGGWDRWDRSRSCGLVKRTSIQKDLSLWQSWMYGFGWNCQFSWNNNDKTYVTHHNRCFEGSTSVYGDSNADSFLPFQLAFAWILEFRTALKSFHSHMKVTIKRLLNKMCQISGRRGTHRSFGSQFLLHGMR
ncbi:hypothetical protein BC830DRAFT_252829 [Chytriomyces sp. MP71]|nr:hypothetical protein BC830DRAFT_252829 [Chytriomyces sp. MP71]